MDISIAKNRFDTILENVSVNLKELKDLLLKSKETFETHAEYMKFDKKKKDEIKDVGGFIGGKTDGMGKSYENIINRSLGVLDLDENVPKDIVEKVKSKYNFKFFIYSTHKSTIDAPRIRIVVPFIEAILPSQYEAIMRYLASLIGIDMVDPKSFLPTQLMYFSSHSKDYMPILYESDCDNLLDPTLILKKFANYKNIEEYPVSKKEKDSISKIITDKMKDKKSKKGYIGAFNRTYSVDSAISKFLSNIYEKTNSKDRYTLIGAETEKGLKVFDNTVAYSHHATDKICGIAVDSFNLVRIHLFSYLDNGKNNGDIKKLKSYKKMVELCEDDEDIKKNLNVDIKSDVNFNYECDDFLNILSRDPVSGKIIPTLENLLYILANDENLKGIRYNEFTSQIDIVNAPWEKYCKSFRDSDLDQLESYLSHNYVQFKSNTIKTALSKISTDRHYNPVIEYLEQNKEWDKVERIPTIFIDFFNADDNIYTREVASVIFVGAIKRIMEEGTKFDYFPVLCGYQGAFKSTFIKKFAKDWFSDSLSLSDIKDKTAAEKLQGNWFIEAPELSGLKKAEIESIKAFASRQDDKYRPSYGRVVESHPRRCIIWGTTNAENGFLRDVTGNRRFLVIKFSGKSKMQVKDIDNDFIDMVWAEAYYKYKKGYPIVLSEEAEKIAVKVQKDSMEQDDRLGIVYDYLEKLLPTTWNDLSINDRKSYITGYSSHIGKVKRKYVSNVEIWSECFQKNPLEIKRPDSFDISSIMAKLPNWKMTGKARRIGKYGVHKVYKRIEGENGYYDNVEEDNGNKNLLNGFNEVNDDTELPFA